MSDAIPDDGEKSPALVRVDGSDEETREDLIALSNDLEMFYAPENRGGKSRDDGVPEELAKEIGETVLSVVPGVGEVLSARDAYIAFRAAREAINRGDMSETGMQAALVALGVGSAIPGASIVFRGAKQIAKYLVKSGRRVVVDKRLSRTGDNRINKPDDRKVPKKVMRDLPNILENPEAVLWDKRKENFF